MRRLFIVLAKLIGALQVVGALTYFSTVVFVVRDMSRFGSGALGFILQTVGILLYSFLAFGFAWLLMMRTEWLADKLRVPADGDIPAFSSDTALLATGIRIVGVFTFVSAFPALCKTIADIGMRGLWSGNVSGVWTGVVPALLQTILAFIAMVRTHYVLRLLSKGEQTHGKRLIVFWAVFFALLIVLSRFLPIYVGYSADHIEFSPVHADEIDWPDNSHLIGIPREKTNHQSFVDSVEDQPPATNNNVYNFTNFFFPDED